MSRFLQKHAILLALIAPGIFSTAAAAQSLMSDQYRGGGVLREVSGCDGWTGRYGVEAMRVRIRPAGQGQNSPTHHQISAFFGTYASHFVVSAAAEGIMADVAAFGWIGSRAGFGDHFLPMPRMFLPMPRMQYTSSIYEDELTIRGRIENFDVIEGCTMDFSVVTIAR